MQLTEKQARQRWSDPSFQEQFMPVIAAIQSGSAAFAGLNLAGISIGGGPVPQLWNANLFQAKLEDVDMSFAKLACSMNETELRRVRLAGAELDRCLVRKAALFDCDFKGANLVVNLDDSVCEGCSFMEASILGGKAGSEYGGRRVKFVNCDFTDAVFKGVEFRASRFVNCSFAGARFIQCDLRGAKVEGGVLPTLSQFELMEVPEWAIVPPNASR